MMTIILNIKNLVYFVKHDFQYALALTVTLTEVIMYTLLVKSK